MKSLFLTLLTACSYLCLTAQTAPTITTADLPVIGTTYNFIKDSLFSAVMTAGSSTAQTWNYSLSTHNIENQTFASPVGMPGSASFTSATLGYHNSVDSNVAYFYSNSTGLYADGLYSYNLINNPFANIPLNFSPDQVVIPTPFTLNDTRNDNAKCVAFFTYLGNNLKYTITINKTLNADAFGSLTTLGGTFPNTLRIKEYKVQLDTAYVDAGGGNYIFVEAKQDTSTTFSWLRSGDPKAVLLNLDMVKYNSMTSKGGRYLTLTSKVDNTLETSTPTHVYPNPTKEQLYIDLNSTPQAQMWVITDLSGKVIFRQSVSGFQKAMFDLSAQPSGMYIWQLYDTKGKLIQANKFIKS